MKKQLLTALSVIMAVLMLTGCGQKTETEVAPTKVKDKVKDSYNVDAVAQAVALTAYKDQAWMKRNAAKIVKTRERLTKALMKRGWDVLPSEANFIFAKPPAGNTDATEIFALLKKRNIFTRYFAGPKTGDRLRITIGTEEQTTKLLEALDALCQQA